MSTPRADCSLLVFILNDPDRLDDTLSAMLEAGVQGATVLEGRGMWQVLSSEVQIFTGLSTLFPSTKGAKPTIVSAVPTSKIAELAAIIEDVVGDLTSPGTGILMSLPLSQVWGLAKNLETETEEKPA
jgi:hypothetical protein